MRVAVIGAGRISRQHLACLRELPGVSVVGLCDLSPALAEAAAERFGVPEWFADHRELLELEPDVVHVATPASSHYALARDALAAGAHVFVEKPIATNLQDLESLLELAKQQERVVLEDHNYLYNRPVAQLLEAARHGEQGEQGKRGELGEVVHVEVHVAFDALAPENGMADPNLPHPSLALPGGVVAEFVTHMAYLCHAFVGAHGSVASSWSKRTPMTPLPCDEFRALVEAERGTALLCFSTHARPQGFQLRVHGTRMRAEADLWEPRLVRQHALGGPRALVPLRAAGSRGWQELRSGLAALGRPLRGGPGVYEGQWELLRQTYAALASGAPPPIDAERILAVNRLVNELFSQARQACGS